MMRFREGRFSGKDMVERPTCPFCGQLIERPDDSGKPSREMPVGSCSCGAAYACDVTGHNLGTALIEALVSACHGDWDAAWDLVPEDDYLQKEIDHYDYETHLIIPGGAYQGRRIGGTLFFIRLHKDIRGERNETTGRDLPDVTSSVKRASTPARVLTKKDVESLIESYDLAALVSIAHEDKKILRDLKRLLYSGDRLVRWRVAEALGRTSSVIAQRDHGTIVRLLQGFFSSVTDTASSSWGAVDAIGEIISGKPEPFSGFIPQIYALTRDRALLAQILRALGKIGNAKPDLIRKTAFHVISLLKDPDPEVRAYAAILLGNVKALEARDDLMMLEGDTTLVEIYEEGMLHKRTVGQLAAESLSKI